MLLMRPASSLITLPESATAVPTDTVSDRVFSSPCAETGDDNKTAASEAAATMHRVRFNTDSFRTAREPDDGLTACALTDASLRATGCRHYAVSAPGTRRCHSMHRAACRATRMRTFWRMC